MLYTKEQVINGLTSYVDSEVVSKLPTAGKWVVGTAAGLYLKKLSDNMDSDIMKETGVVNSDGLWDIDLLACKLKENASRYGNIQMNLPAVGMVTFTPDDIDICRRYIT